MCSSYSIAPVMQNLKVLWILLQLASKSNTTLDYHFLSMKRVKYCVTFFFLICIFACKNAKQYQMPRKNELMEIIEAVIAQDSLPVVDVTSRKGTGSITSGISYPLMQNLRKIKITVPNKNIRKGLILELPNIETKSIFNLLVNFHLSKKKSEGGISFSKLDYQYLLYQNTVMHEFVIDSTFPIKLNLISEPNAKRINQSNIPMQYYELTIPILSLYGLKAYVEITNLCGGLCSSSKGVYLEKINGRWVITKREQLWIA